MPPTIPRLACWNAETRLPAWYGEGSAEYFLGTDRLGLDILSRIIYGARISVIVVAIVISAGAIGGTAIGVFAGYFGGNIDELIMRFVDFNLAVPFILVGLLIVTAVGQSLEIVILLLIIFSWPAFARQTRAEALQLREMDYVALARVAGASDFRIMSRHVLVGLINTVIVVASLRVGTLILAESTLSFLGIGVPPPTPAWGLMVAEGRDYISTAWWVSFFPGMAILLTVLATNFIGDWLRDTFDPRLRQL